jgi:hypothetical protein
MNLRTCSRNRLRKTLSFRPDPEQAKRVEGGVEKPASLLINSRRKFTARKSLFAYALFAASLASPLHAHSQGCTQCQDNTAATPPKTQAAYRHAIILLTATASSVFLSSLFLFKRHR